MASTLNGERKEQVVEFLSDGLTIRGVLNLPKGKGPFPIVILGHGLGGLKEWTLPEVGRSLGEDGIAALCFDYRNFGDSEGAPREEVSHYGRLHDWQAAISYTTSLQNIDPERIGVWGTSLGGRDVLALTGFDRRIKAAVAQAPLIKWNSLSTSRMAGYGDDVIKFQHDLHEDQKNRTLGHEPLYVPFVKVSGDDIKDEFIKQLTNFERRNYRGRLTFQSYRLTTLVDVTSFVELISPTPILFILAEEDALPGQKEAYEAAKEPKELVVVPGHHFSPYGKSKSESTKATRKFFSKVFGS